MAQFGTQRKTAQRSRRCFAHHFFYVFAQGAHQRADQGHVLVAHPQAVQVIEQLGAQAAPRPQHLVGKAIAGQQGHGAARAEQLEMGRLLAGWVRDALARLDADLAGVL